MAVESTAPSARIATAFQSLTKSAKSVNEASGALAKPVAALERALQQLNVGVACWVKASSGSADDGSYWSREVGYARVGREWRLAIKNVEGHESFPGDEREESWPFNEAPIHLRLKVVDKLPDLIEQMVPAADATAKRLMEKVGPVEELASAVAAIVNPKKK